MTPASDTRTTPDERTFERELIALIPQIRGFARTLCGDAATGDDLAQDAVAKAWAARHTFALGTNMKAWVFMILRNRFYSDQRRSWRSSPLDPEVAANTLVAVDDPTAALELDEVRRALAMLPDVQREALILVGAAGVSYEDVSAIMGVAVGTIKSRVSRARTRLQELLEGTVIEDGLAPHAAMSAIVAQADVYRSRAA